MSDFSEIHFIPRIPPWGGLQKFPFLPGNDKQELWLWSYAQAMDQMASVTLNWEGTVFKSRIPGVKCPDSNPRSELSDPKKVT